MCSFEYLNCSVLFLDDGSFLFVTNIVVFSGMFLRWLFIKE